jgi:hypothetical protein
MLTNGEFRRRGFRAGVKGEAEGSSAFVIQVDGSQKQVYLSPCSFLDRDAFGSFVASEARSPERALIPPCNSSRFLSFSSELETQHAHRAEMERSRLKKKR